MRGSQGDHRLVGLALSGMRRCWRLSSSPLFAAPATRPARKSSKLHHQHHRCAPMAPSMSPRPSTSTPKATRSTTASTATSRPLMINDDKSRLRSTLTVLEVKRDGHARALQRRQHRQRLQAHQDRRWRRLARAARPHLHHPLHHDPHGAVLRRPRRALLERHRQLLGLPHPQGHRDAQSARWRRRLRRRRLHRRRRLDRARPSTSPARPTPAPPSAPRASWRRGRA